MKFVICENFPGDLLIFIIMQKIKKTHDLWAEEAQEGKNWFMNSEHQNILNKI